MGDPGSGVFPSDSTIICARSPPALKQLRWVHPSALLTLCRLSNGRYLCIQGNVLALHGHWVHILENHQMGNPQTTYHLCVATQTGLKFCVSKCATRFSPLHDLFTDTWLYILEAHINACPRGFIRTKPLQYVHTLPLRAHCVNNNPRDRISHDPALAWLIDPLTCLPMTKGYFQRVGQFKGTEWPTGLQARARRLLTV